MSNEFRKQRNCHGVGARSDSAFSRPETYRKTVMKTLHHSFVPSRRVLATVLALSLTGLGAQAAPAPPAMPKTLSSAAPTSLAPSQPPATGGVQEDIFDIHGPIHIPASSSTWIYWTSGAMAAVGLVIGTWRILRRPRRKQPYEIALEKLEAARPLMGSASAAPFSLAVSEIVRVFIEECLPVRAARRTTDEFLHDLVNMPDSPLAPHRAALADFLEHCDLAKFAKWSLTVPQMEAMLYSARAFVLAVANPAPSKKASEKGDHSLIAAVAHP
jgi:hypothetical protein